jgi:hypothetical protein
VCGAETPATVAVLGTRLVLIGFRERGRVRNA